ncbi:prostaglandin F2 receptor negative regulator-like isoform X2 [Myxocyprinus asiaticus]|uniref:prostaglandin F2 receptor negative regulator-like isoform X2 n=1 Tax=Myxocyprinus asiaticus TaxID=70543 RepID=UPI002221D602|nr:prostaglandin F2 receptor negative regulator-like isoform X2 [Myxocyprinus asiaticus]
MGKTRTLILLWAAVGLCHCRVVTVPKGPLLRVEGQPLSLRCDVSDYEGPKEQDFEWTVTRGTETANVISTFDPMFSDRSLEDRIRSGDISVMRLGDNVVELRIKEARVTDSATYSCSTPSTDSVINGNYDATVQLQVVPNSLIVAPEAPNPVVPEGGSIRLLCNVSHNFIEGIYLSVTWSVMKGPFLLKELITFGPDLGVTVGDSSMQRYTDGGIRPEMGNGVSHSLVLSGVLPEDQGMYVCAAGLWTRQQGVWDRIQEKSVEMGEVAVTPTANSLTVQVQDSTTLSSGDTLLLTCSITTDDVPTVDLEVTWLLNTTRVLAHLGRDGVLANTSDVVEMRRLGKWDFQIKIHSTDMSDMGLYSCKVSAWIQHNGGRWYKAAEKISAPVRVHVTKQNPVYTVVLDTPVTARFSGDPTELECKVTNVSNLHRARLGVSWFYKGALHGDDTAAAQTIASLDDNGTLVPGKSYRGRIEAGLIIVTRTEPYTFKLRLLHTTDADAGEYSCGVTAWIPSRHGNLKKVAEFLTPALKVSFAKKRAVMGVVARRLREATAAGSTFEMSCQANTQNLPQGFGFSILILSEEAVGSPSRKLASLGPDMVLRLEDWGEPGRRDSLMLVKSGKKEFQFRIQGVQVTDRGFYSCEMRAWTKQPGEDWVEMAKGVSNKVQIAFEHRGPTFDVSIDSDTTSVYPWETAKMECDVSVTGTPPATDDVAYEMKWFLSRLRGSNSPSLLASMDRWGVVHKMPRNDSSDCSLERMGPQTFTLNIHSTQDSNAGEYHCTATPWIRSTTTGAWSKAPDVTSKRVFLNVKFALWDSMKLPLLYGICASVTVGVVSLILGLICAHCCCKNTTPTPRSRTKLMELEMD